MVINEKSEATRAAQKEILDLYEEMGKAWLARVQEDIALWSTLATKLTTTRSVPEAVEAYTKCVSQQMHTAAEDGQRILKDCQQITQALTKSVQSGWPTGAST